MANSENIPPGGISDSQKASISTSDEVHSRSTGRLSIRTTNTLPTKSDAAILASRSLQETEQNPQISPTCPQDVPLPQSDDTEWLLESTDQAERRSSTIPDDEAFDQIRADPSEANSTDDEFSFDDSDVILDDDDDIPLDEDPFFGDPTAQIPGQVTEEQLEEIRKALEEADLAQKSEDEMPAPLKDDAPGDALLSKQNSSPKAIVVNVGFSFSTWVYLVVEPNEPIFEMKLKFIQAADLAIEDLDRLEFSFESRILEDDDTVEQLGIQQDSNIYCQMIGVNGRPSSNRRYSSALDSNSNNDLVADVINRRNSNESTPWNWSM